MSEKNINKIGFKRGNVKATPRWVKRKFQHHPGAKQMNISGYNGIDSYTDARINGEGAGYSPQSIVGLKKGTGECMNPVQGPLGKHARLHRERIIKFKNR